MGLNRIVVGIDGSENSARAAAWAAALAAVVGAEVIAVHAAGLLAHLAPGVTVPAATHKEELRHVFEETWCAPLNDAGVCYRTRLEDGPPTMAVLRVADDQDADLVVLGTRGMGGAPGLLLGSTSHQVVQLAQRPVVVVPLAQAR